MPSLLRSRIGGQGRRAWSSNAQLQAAKQSCGRAACPIIVLRTSRETSKFAPSRTPSQQPAARSAPPRTAPARRPSPFRRRPPVGLMPSLLCSRIGVQGVAPHAGASRWHSRCERLPVNRLLPADRSSAPRRRGSRGGGGPQRPWRNGWADETRASGHRAGRSVFRMAHELMAESSRRRNVRRFRVRGFRSIRPCIRLPSEAASSHRKNYISTSVI